MEKKTIYIYGMIQFKKKKQTKLQAEKKKNYRLNSIIHKNSRRKI